MYISACKKTKSLNAQCTSFWRARKRFSCTPSERKLGVQENGYTRATSAEKCVLNSAEHLVKLAQIIMLETPLLLGNNICKSHLVQGIRPTSKLIDGRHNSADQHV